MNTTAGGHDLVVARYHESLDRVLDVPPDYRVHIYDKGGPTVPIPVRERAETYVCDFLQLLAGHATWPDVQALSWCWKAPIGHPPAPLLNPERSVVPGLRVREELFSLNTLYPLEWVDSGAGRIGEEYRSLHRLPEGTNICAHFLDMCDLPDAAELAAQHLVGRLSYGGLFAVRNHLIDKIPGRALLRLRQAAIGADPHGYLCERLWLHIFGEAFLFPLRLPGW